MIKLQCSIKFLILFYLFSKFYIVFCFRCPYVGCQSIVTKEDLVDLD